MSGITSTPNTVLNMSVVLYIHSTEKARLGCGEGGEDAHGPHRRVLLLGTFKPGSSQLGFPSVGRDV